MRRVAKSSWVAERKLRASEHHACEAIPQDPEDFMPAIGLEAIEGQHDLPLGRGEALEAGGVGERQSEQFVI